MRRSSLELAAVLGVDQDISVPRLALVHADDRLVGLFQRVSLDPALDVVVAGKLEHLGDTRRCTDGRASDVHVGCRVSECLAYRSR